MSCSRKSFALSALILASCSGASMTGPKATQMEIDAEQQTQRRIAAEYQVEKQSKSLKKRLRYQERIAHVAPQIFAGGVPICARLSDPETSCAYQVELLEGGAANAYADGKKIYISPEMVRLARTDEELAFILAHEYAHNILKHSSRSFTNGMIGTVLGAVVDGALATQGIGTDGGFAKAGSEMATLRYSADFEREADYIALYVAANAGFDISQTADFWRRFAAKNPDTIYISATHPTTAERFVAMEKTVEEIRHKQQRGALLLPELAH